MLKVTRRAGFWPLRADIPTRDRRVEQPQRVVEMNEVVLICLDPLLQVGDEAGNFGSFALQRPSAVKLASCVSVIRSSPDANSRSIRCSWDA
jgi:hypothetical protein